MKKISSHLISEFLALIAILSGIFALVGWILHMPFLASFGSLVPMSPSSALLFLIFGILVFSHKQYLIHTLRFWIILAVGATGVIIALILFFLSYFGIHLNLEHLGIPITGAVGSVPLGYISPITAFLFIMSGLSFLLMHSSKPGMIQGAIPAFILASMVVMSGIILVLAYILGAPVLYWSAFIPPALSTSISFIALGSALVVISGKFVWTLAMPIDAADKRTIYYLNSIFLLLAAGIITAGYLYYRNYERKYKTEIEHQLSAIADLKASQIIKWKNERFDDASVLYNNLAFSRLVEQFLSKKEPSNSRDLLRSWLTQIQSAYKYERIKLMDINGKILIQVPGYNDKSSPISPNWILEANTLKRIVFHDLYKDSSNNRVFMSILIPVVSRSGLRKVIAIVEIRIDPREYLYPMIRNWPLPSKTAENLIVRRDRNNVLFLNELRFNRNTSLNLRIPLTEKRMLAVRAVLGEKGNVEGIDYRDVEVIGYITSVEGTPWYLVSRMDKSELYAQLRNRLWGIILLIGTLLVCTGTIVGYIWRHQYYKNYREKYETQKKLNASVEKFIRAFQTKAAFMAIMRSSGMYVDVNDFALPFLGYSPGEMIGKNPESLGLFPELTMPQKIQEEMQRSGFIHNMEVRLRTKDGSPRYGNMSIETLESEDDILWLTVITDITAFKDAEAKVFKLNRVYAVLSDINQAIVRIRDPLELYDKVCKIAVEKGKLPLTWIGLLDEKTGILMPVANAGRSKEYLEKINICLHDPPCEVCPIDKSIRDGGFHSYNITSQGSKLKQCKNVASGFGLHSVISFGLKVSGQIKGTINFYASEPDFFNPEEIRLLEELAMDISFSMEFNEIEAKRERAEISLFESERRLHLLIDGVTDYAIYSLDASGKITSWNKGAERLHGYSLDEVIGKHYSMFFTVQDQERNQPQELLEKAMLKGNIQMEGERVCKNGSKIIANSVITALYNDDKTLYGFAKITQDITQRRQNEKEMKKMNNLLEERVKERTAELHFINKELESFSYSISHDLKTPLRAINGFATFLKEDHSSRLDPEGLRLLSVIISNAKRMDQLIDDILTISKISRKEIVLQWIDMKAEAFAVYKELTDEGQLKKIQFNVADIPGIRSDPVLIKQIWTNLISNAIKYTSKKKSPIIEITGKSEEGKIIYYVRDNGAGFNPKFASKLFNLFQRLHSLEEYEGTGVGLAIVKRIVERFGGDVGAEGKLDEGARFYFSLPDIS